MNPSQSLFSNSVFQSLGIHFSLVAIFALVSWLTVLGSKKTVDLTSFEVVEAPLDQKTIPLESKPMIQPKAQTQAVFGQSTKTLTDANSELSPTKAGNTIAKAQDQKQLNDDTTLPIPTADYLVSSMPILMNEFKVPYPEEARARKIQGPVVMELLIDETGKVRKASIVSGLGSGLDEAALLAANKLQFKPAEIEGKSVAVKIRYTYNFVLNP